MSDLNLLRYYTRLAPLGVAEPIKLALSDIAERLFTSLRHARNLLNQMQKHGWLNWEPKVGRNQRSTLILNIELSELKQLLAAERVRQGRYEKALVILDNDQRSFGRLLQSTSGASIREGRLHIQLTYKRPFERLVPHQLQRSSERFFLRQIYCCLVSSDSKGHVQPELAHHWECANNACQWTFYLRPGLVFHNGDIIDSDTIVSLFAKLSSLDDYQTELAHLVTVSAPQPHKVVFTLSQPDLGFAGLISGVRYAIQPTSQVNNAQTYDVIGSGPFEVQEHSSSQLKLQAFERFYACRALTDQVTIWLLEGQEPNQPMISTNQPGAGAVATSACNYYLSSEPPQSDAHETQHSRVEDGCMFVLFNQNAASPLSEAQRRSLSNYLSADKLAVRLQQQGAQFGSVVASNLLPSWHKITRPLAPETRLPKKLTIAVYDYTALKNCAEGIRFLLEQQGIRVKVNTYSYRQLIQQSKRQTLTEELIITNMNLDDNRHASAFANLFHNPVLHNAIGPQASQWFHEALRQLRAVTPLNQYLDALEPLASALITEYWLTPLFHHRQTLRFHGVLKDVALTNWGWPDIKNVWSAD